MRSRNWSIHLPVSTAISALVAECIGLNRRHWSYFLFIIITAWLPLVVAQVAANRRKPTA